MQTKDGKLMLTSRLHIVGLPYHEVGGCLGEFFAEAQGRAMTLRPEPTNEWDANAICAYDWQGRHVGYVSGIAFYEAVMTRHGVEEEREYQVPEESPIYLSTARGQKIDLIRVLNVMYEQGRFNGKDGAKLMKKEFFATMGRALNVDLSDYDKHLSRAFSDGTKLEKNICVFDDMKEKMIAIWNSK